MPRKKIALQRAEVLSDVVLHDIRPILLSIKINGKTEEYRGNTILEALQSIETPKFIKGKSEINVSTGKMHSTMTLWPAQFKRLTGTNISKQILNKQLSILLK